VMRSGSLGREPAPQIAPPSSWPRAGAAHGPRALQLDACSGPGHRRRHAEQSSTGWVRSTPEEAACGLPVSTCISASDGGRPSG
jgi:hypothetical protein